MEPEGGERARTARPTSAPAPSFAQEMALCSQKGRRCRAGGRVGGLQTAVPTMGQLRVGAQAERRGEEGAGRRAVLGKDGRLLRTSLSAQMES